MIWLTGPSAAMAQITAEQALADSRLLPTITGCPGSPDPSEIVVCGSRAGRSADAYRLPLPDERGADYETGNAKGEVPRASAERLPGARCGIFQGERQCSKAESAHYGYGEGRDPVTFLAKLGSKLSDPDADVEPPPPPGRSRKQ